MSITQAPGANFASASARSANGTMNRDMIDTEERRGAAPRFWEDVEVGAPVQPMLEGPLNITDMIR